MTHTREEVLSSLQNMDEYEFEHFVADLWTRQGWRATVTRGSSDRGIDVIAEKQTPFHQKQVIQAKRYSPDTKVGSPDIQQYSSLRHQESDVDAVVVVTTSSFTQQGEEIAADLNIKTVDGSEICGLISDLHAEDLLQEYNLHASTDQQNQSHPSISKSVNNSSTNLQQEDSSFLNHPFDGSKDLKRVNSDQTHFEKCPECLGGNVWFAMIDGNRHLKCADCRAAWRKATRKEKGWIFTTKIQGWEEYQGPNEGKLKSKREWNL